MRNVILGGVAEGLQTSRSGKGRAVVQLARLACDKVGRREELSFVIIILSWRLAPEAIAN